MKTKSLLWLVLLLPLLLLLNKPTLTAAAGEVQIIFESNPSLSQVRPHGGPTGHIDPDEVFIEVRDAQGALIPNVQIDLQMVAPQTNWFISTDVPRIEGVDLINYHFVSATGRQTFNYIFPIRGQYAVTVKASPLTAGAFNPTTQTFDVNIAEKESSVIILTLFLLVLFSFGLASGSLLMRSHLAAKASKSVARTSTQGSVILIFGMAVLVGIWIVFLLQAETADASETAERLATAQLSETESASSTNAKLDLSVQSPSAITPSQPANLTGVLTDLSGAPIQKVHYAVSVVQIEDDKTVFATETDSPDGALAWAQDFWDGTEHYVKIVASPTGESSTRFEPVTLEHIVEVTPLAPPLRVKVLGLVYLTVIVGAGVTAGLMLARRRALK